MVSEKKSKKRTRANLAHFGARFGAASGLALSKGLPRGRAQHLRDCRAFLRASFSSSRRLLSYHTLKLACLCVGALAVSTCWNAGTCNTLESALEGQRPASLVRLQILRAHSPKDIMSSAPWVHLQLPRVAHHLTPANQHQQQSSQPQRHLHQPHNILKMEQKIAEMKPSKRYAPTPTTFPLPVKPRMMLNKWESLRGNNAEKKLL